MPHLRNPCLLPFSRSGIALQLCFSGRAMIKTQVVKLTTQQLGIEPTQDDIDALQEELIDRFGLLPEPTQTLVESHRLRILGKPLDLMKIDASAQAIMVQFGPDTPIHPQRVIQLVQQRRHYRLAGQDKLRIEKPIANLRERVTEIKNILRELAPAPNPAASKAAA